MICVFFTFSGAGFLYLLVAVFTDTPLVIYWGIWAVLDLLPLVTLIKYIDFRVFTDSGGIWVGAQQKSHMGS